MKKNRGILCGGISLLISAVFFCCCLKIPVLAEKISNFGNINMIVYGMTLVLFCAVFFLGMLITGSRKMPELKVLEKPVVKKWILAVFLAGQAVFWAIALKKETDQLYGVSARYVWHTQPFWLIMLLFAVEAVVCIWIYKRCKVKENEGEFLVWLIYFVLTILIWYSMYTPNIFGRGSSGDYYHGHAYFNSIYNVHWGMPYTAEMTSIYGHYALLWKIPMKLIGGDFYKFAFLLAGVGALTYLCAFLVLQKLVKSRILRILGAISLTLPILGMRGGYYWQVWPHRMVFPMILLLYAVCVFKKNKYTWKTILPGYVICVLGVLWNTETGMILAVAWAAVHICQMLSEGTLTVGRFILRTGGHILGIAGSFFGAYGLVNLYNVLKYSPANTIKEFLIPLLSDKYMTDILHLDMQFFPSAYMGEIAVFFLGVALGIAGLRWFRKSSSPREWQVYAVFFLSVSALGRLTYYINRPAYHNLDCCHLSVIILAAYLGDRGLAFWKNRGWKNLEEYTLTETMRGGISLVCMLVVLATATGSVLLFSQNSETKNNFHNTKEIDMITDTIAAQIPRNTFAFGVSVAELYSKMHWCTNCFTMDFSDLGVTPGAAENLIETMKTSDVTGAFTSQYSLDIFEKVYPEGYQWFMDTYMLEKTFPVYNDQFEYYVKR